MINLVVKQIKTWTDLFLDYENQKSMNDYINKMLRGNVSLYDALNSYYKKVFSSFGHIIGYPDSFDTFKNFIFENSLLKINLEN